MEKKLEEMTVIELKALAYDQVVKLEAAMEPVNQFRDNIRVIQQEIQKKLTEVKPA